MSRLSFLFTALVVLTACEEDEKKPSLRPSIDYSLITAETPYSELFVDENGQTTVDLTEGHERYKMFQALNYHQTSSISANTAISADVLSQMFTNTGSPFYDIATSTINVTGSDLNDSDVQLRDVVASSLGTSSETVRAQFETWFDEVANASNSVNQAASVGQAGKLGNYLLDARGIETAQVIQKSLIGALQLDYIGNVLLDEGLTADNYSTVGDQNYTALEHNWDIAYGMLTLNPVYLQGSNVTTRGTTEFAMGTYIWEYNKTNFAAVYPAFLKGRAAIVNNDKATLREQADFIRLQMEQTVVNSALGYLDKWKQSGTTPAAQAHAIAEGLGFIYSLRFCTKLEGTAAFSDQILNDLIGSENGFWDLTVTKINAASDAIKEKFNVQ